MRFAHILVSLHGAPAEKKGIWLERGEETRILKEMWKKTSEPCIHCLRKAFY